MRAIVPSHSKFHLNRTIWNRVIAKNDFQYGVRPPSWIGEFLIFCYIFVVWDKICIHIPNFVNSDGSRLKYGDITIFKMAAVRHVRFIMTSSYCTRRRSWYCVKFWHTSVSYFLIYLYFNYHVSPKLPIFAVFYVFLKKYGKMKNWNVVTSKRHICAWDHVFWTPYV